MRVAWPRALALIDHYRDDIETAAAALLRRGELDAQQIEAMIGGGWMARVGRAADGPAIKQTFLFQPLGDALITTTETTALALYIIVQATGIVGFAGLLSGLRRADHYNRPIKTNHGRLLI